MAVCNNLPTGGWDVVTAPHHVPYRIFGIERAFAFEWWITLFALPAVGIYALALLLGVRVLTAALVGLILVLSPVVQWWTWPAPGATSGNASLGATGLIAAPAPGS